MENPYLESVRKTFDYYKIIAEKAMAQVPEEKLFWQYSPESNSIAIIVQHLWGNMLSRWTDLLTSDGEKDWRNRDAEFESILSSREQVQQKWDEGWKCLYDALDSLTGDDLEKIVYIRNMGHTVMEAINRQIAHYSYHIGQIVFLGKMICDEKWTSLSVPRGSSNAYNSEKFSKPRRKEHFTDEYKEQNITPPSDF